MDSPNDSTHVVEGHARNQLRGKPYHALQRVSCEYRDGALILRGRLPTYYLKQMAQSAVARIEGVQRVINDIEVVPDACTGAAQPAGALRV